RTLRTVDGHEIAGRTVVDAMIHRTLSNLSRTRRSDQRDDIREGLLAAMQQASNPSALLEEFDALADDWTPPETTGFEPDLAASA
ncbi:MAG: hypothetical protein HKP30_15770, partial [Myxococcales bacterium]|nr:hypothetical protein [Myxococcales bacterium]